MQCLTRSDQKPDINRKPLPAYIPQHTNRLIPELQQKCGMRYAITYKTQFMKRLFLVALLATSAISGYAQLNEVCYNDTSLMVEEINRKNESSWSVKEQISAWRLESVL